MHYMVLRVQAENLREQMFQLYLNKFKVVKAEPVAEFIVSSKQYKEDEP